MESKLLRCMIDLPQEMSLKKMLQATTYYKVWGFELCK